MESNIMEITSTTKNLNSYPSPHKMNLVQPLDYQLHNVPMYMMLLHVLKINGGQYRYPLSRIFR